MQRSIAERAASQLGHITRQQLVAIGLTRRQVAIRSQQGALIAVGRRTFRVGGAPASWEASVMAACLEHSAVASHRTAARLHGLSGFAGCPIIEVMARERQSSGDSVVALVHRSTSLPTGDVATCGVIPATSVARTILGLAALETEVTDDALREAVDVAVRDGVATDRWLWWLLESRRCSGRNGVTRMEALLQDRSDSPTESWLEREFLRVLSGAGLPLPVVQRRIRAKGGFVARVDCCYDSQLLCIEVKGHRSHSTQAQLTADARRENALVLAGYRVMSFTYDDVVCHPADVANVVRNALPPRHVS